MSAAGAMPRMASTAAEPCGTGVHVANARGVPGSAGPRARDSSGRAVLLTTHHVAFGAGALEGDVVWARTDPVRSAFERLGRAIGGMRGRVEHAGRLVFVDYAVVLLESPESYSAGLRQAVDELPELAGPGRADAGEPVAKLGAVSGRTHGMVVDADYYDRPFLDGEAHEAPGQLLIAPKEPRELFSAPGDSGAALVDSADRVIGLMWGCTVHGQGMASPIGAIVEHFGLERVGA